MCLARKSALHSRKKTSQTTVCKQVVRHERDLYAIMQLNDSTVLNPGSSIDVNKNIKTPFEQACDLGS